MKFASRLPGKMLIFAFVAVVAIFSGTAMAGEGGEGGGAPAPMVFTVNIGSDNYLQFGVIFEAAKPEAEHLVDAYKPEIQHEIILLLSDKNVDKLRTLEGKKALMSEILNTTNHVIHETEKTGIKEVFLTKFIIQ